jgi:flavodoxin
MMNTLVVHESMWGNTKAVAEAVARGLGEDVTILHVAEAPTPVPDGIDLLVVGGPTHAFSLTRASTRRDAIAKGAAADPAAPGIREWLGQLPASSHLDVATFDTRVGSVRHLPGSAAKAAGKAVRRHRLGRLVATMSFYVDDVSGPLLDGEVERAHAWGRSLAEVRAAHGPRAS